MGEIINLIDERKNIDIKKELLNTAFVKLFSDDKKFRHKYMYEFEDESYEFLLIYSEMIFNGLKKSNWINYKKIDKFLNLYYKINKKNNEGDDLNVTFKRALLICLCDKNQDILNKNQELVLKVLDGIANGIDDVQITNISNIASEMFDSRIEEFINSNKIDSDIVYSNVAYGLSEGLSLNQIISSTNKDNNNDDDLSSGTFTIDRYKNYYLKQATYLYEVLDNYITEIDINIISVMSKINKYSDISKYHFLKIMGIISNANMSIVDKTIIASELTHYFIINRIFIDRKSYRDIYNDVIYSHNYVSCSKPKKL